MKFTVGCGSACTMHTKFDSNPSPECIHDFSVTISGGSVNYKKICHEIHKIILQNWFLWLHTYSVKYYLHVHIGTGSVCMKILSKSHIDWKSNVISIWSYMQPTTAAYDDDDNELRLLWFPEK